MQFELMPQDLQVVISKRLPDLALCYLRNTCRFFRDSTAFNREWLRRQFLSQTRQYNVIPEFLLQHCLAWQDPEVLQEFAKLLEKIHYQLRHLLHTLPQAKWMIYALLNQPLNVARALSESKPHHQYQPFHYYALAGHWDAFWESYQASAPLITTQSKDHVVRWAICGGHVEFLQRLKLESRFAYTWDDERCCEIALLAAIAGGDLDQVKILTPQRIQFNAPGNGARKLFGTTLIPELELNIDHITPLRFRYALHAVKHGQFAIYDWLTSGEKPYCKIFRLEELIAVLEAAAEHNNLQLVQQILEDDSWQALAEESSTPFNSIYDDTKIIECTLRGGAMDVLRDLIEHYPELLQQHRDTNGNTPLHTLAKHLQNSEVDHWQWVIDIAEEFGMELLYEKNAAEQTVFSLLPSEYQEAISFQALSINKQ